jgi:hypothetical protein
MVTILVEGELNGSKLHYLGLGQVRADMGDYPCKGGTEWVTILGETEWE